MYLSKKITEGLTGTDIPQHEYFQLSEKVLQFGAGVLLRALPDYFIDKANKRNVFNGRVLVVKSTDSDADPFDLQDGLYTHCIRGIENGNMVEQNLINASISRVLPAKTRWEEILQSAGNPALQLVISNTTEVGITLTEDNIHASPPESFPGKLLAFLYRRFVVFKGDISKGLVIIPTELIPDNGNILLSILVKLADQNGIGLSFLEWLKNANYFCNSLVDRIVPGRPHEPQISSIENELGYEDRLLLMSEPYSLWAIESSSEKVREILSFGKVDNAVIIAPDINIFRELKLRLLNGSHTFSCGLAVLAGIVHVKEGMEDSLFGSYVKKLMLDEIVPSITSESLSLDDAVNFSKKVIDRFSNPYIEHPWLAITMQYSSKMCLRNVPVITNYVKRFNSVPDLMALGFAAHILFMKPVEIVDGKYYGAFEGEKYLINDNNAAYYENAWRTQSAENASNEILANTKLWGTDLSEFSDFSLAVARDLLLMRDGNIKKVIATILEK